MSDHCLRYARTIVDLTDPTGDTTLFVPQGTILGVASDVEGLTATYGGWSFPVDAEEVEYLQEQPITLDYDLLATDNGTYYAMVFDASSGTDLASTTLYATADEADSAACDLITGMHRAGLATWSA